jgi:hypothetical protein
MAVPTFFMILGLGGGLGVPVGIPPNSKAAAGKTNYLGVAGKDGMFPGEKGVTMADVTDGTADTVMLVEASDHSAVAWTKPDDFQPNPANPIKGLVGLQPGRFLAAFVDGSTRVISSGVDAETLRRLFNRHDGKPVDLESLDRPPARPATKPSGPQPKVEVKELRELPPKR